MAFLQQLGVNLIAFEENAHGAKYTQKQDKIQNNHKNIENALGIFHDVSVGTRMFSLPNRVFIVVNDNYEDEDSTFVPIDIDSDGDLVARITINHDRFEEKFILFNNDPESVNSKWVLPVDHPVEGYVVPVTIGIPECPKNHLEDHQCACSGAHTDDHICKKCDKEHLLDHKCFGLQFLQTTSFSNDNPDTLVGKYIVGDDYKLWRFKKSTGTWVAATFPKQPNLMIGKYYVLV
jgi:hypothetical protein